MSTRNAKLTRGTPAGAARAVPATAREPAVFGRPLEGWRLRLYIVIFEADTRAGRLFDLWLIGLILLSVFVVMLDSVRSINARHGELFRVLEWMFTVLFTIEYIA